MLDHGLTLGPWRFRAIALETVAALILAAGAANAVAVAQSGTPSDPAVQQVIVGPNVNMVGGPASYVPGRDPELIGDPFLQRQNEPSLATSSRNPCHLLAGANDYRAVDLEQAVGIENADAWLGVFKSFDCGATWTSYLLPGHPVDNSPSGLASPLKGRQAAADATVRAGTSGLFYYSGIAFDRGDNGIGKVFVARFVDRNNKDGGDPIRYLGTLAIDVGTSGQFLDKPWLAVDVPRGSGATCVVDGQTVPAGNVYLTYSTFVGSGNNARTKIMFSRSTDCGATWSNPEKLSERFARNQGTVIGVDPATGAIQIAWREFTDPSDASSVHSILVARSTDGGRSFTKAQRIEPADPSTGLAYRLQPFDQAASPVTFRTNAYPTLAIVPAEAEGRPTGQPSRIYVAWAARGFAALRADQTLGDARIVMSSSLDGTSWTSPRAVDASPGAGHQVMPALAFAGGKLALAYYDLRENASLTHDDFVVEYGAAALAYCQINYLVRNYPSVLACMVLEATAPRRHTVDLRAAMADASCLAGGTCAFASYSVSGSTRVSSYVAGRAASTGQRIQLQYNRPNLPLFRKGTYPFIGDYIDIAGPAFVPDGQGGWSWNSGQTAGRPAPVFHVSWADNRDVKRPGDTNWASYTPAVTGPAGILCQPGQSAVRNQNIYTAQLRPGLIVSAPLNAKKVTSLQRSFVVVAQNSTAQQRSYTLSLDPPAGIVASFDQFLGFDGASAPVTTIAAVIPPRSSISRTVFVGLAAPPSDPSQAPAAVVPVVVEETGLGASSSDTVYLNPDFDNPDFDNPDFDNTELHNPDFDNPDFDNFTLNTSIRNPDFDNPDFDNPDFDNPDFDNPDFDNPDFDNPDFDNPDFDNPDFDNPDFDNPDFDNASVSDLTWPVYNTGNTTSGYKVNLNVANAPPGVKYQLLVRRVYASPVVKGCALGQSAQNQALVNIVEPQIDSPLQDRSFNDPSRTNASFSLAPGEKAKVTLRAYCKSGSCPLGGHPVGADDVSLGVVAQAANCVTCTGPACTPSDFVLGETECQIDDGPPRDVWDPVPPALSTPNVPPADDADNDGTEPMSFSVHATDNVAVAAVSCAAGGAPLSLVSVSGDAYAFAGSFPIGVTTVTCTATDTRVRPAPNATTASFDVRVNDVTPPVFDSIANPGAPFVPGNPAEATGPAGAQVFFTNPTATDSNGGTVVVACASSVGLVSGSVFPIGTTPIDCTAADRSGVSTPPTHLFDVTVADTTGPLVTIAGAPTGNVEGNALGGGIVTFSASAADLVSGTLVPVCAPASGSLFPIGTTAVVCQAADAGGNSGSASLNVTVVDTTAPAVSLVGSSAVTLEAGAAYSDAGATANDLVYGPLSVSAAGSVNTLIPGTYSIVYTATDGSGNTASATRTVTVVDTTPPVLTLPANISVEATSAAGSVVQFTASASDVVDATPTVSCTPSSGSTFPLGFSTVSCTATDDFGNASGGGFNVTVVDTTKPVVSLVGPSAVTLEAGTPYSDAGATATDLVYGSLSVSAAGTLNTLIPGTYSIVYTATDGSGNTASATRTVTVVDTTPPVLTLPASISVEATSAAGSVVQFTASASDVVDATPTVSCTPSSGSTFPLGVSTVSCTASDDFGSASGGSFNVTVVDTTAPSSITASVSPALLWPPDGTIAPVTVSGTAVDGGSGVARLDWSVTDEYGTHQPSGSASVPGNGPFSFPVPLLRDRRGSDKDGRHYTINVTAVDRSGNGKVLATPLAVNVHDQSGK